MHIKGITDEDFINYKKPSMFIAFPYCSFKCEKESGVRCCQNSDLAKSPTYEISMEDIVERYINNPITSAIVFGGLEPFDSFDELLDLISVFRKHTSDDIVIYTGYLEEELQKGYYSCGDYNSNTRRNAYCILKQYPNIIIKFGRFVPNQTSHFDSILGVELASDNQYAKLVSKKKNRRNNVSIIENPDKEYVREIRESLKLNSGYCPCSTIKSPDTKCMCKEFREQEEGECRCGLYIKTRDNKS